MKSITIILPLIGAAMLCQAQGTVDQSLTAPYNGAANIDEAAASVGQIFTAGLSGTLEGVNIDVYSWSTLPLHVRILAVAGGEPDSTVLGDTTLSESGVTLDNFISFPQLIQVVAGTQYAIVVDYVGAPPPGPGHAQGVWDGAFSNMGLDYYPAGYATAWYGQNWTPISGGDLLFRTYVRPVPEPGTLGLFAGGFAMALIRFAGSRTRTP